MKWFLILPLFVFGYMTSLAAYGADDPKQKRIYKLMVVTIGLILLVLANFG